MNYFTDPSSRSRALLLNVRASAEAKPRVAQIMAGELGRDKTWQGAQGGAYRALAAGYMLPGSVLPANSKGREPLETSPA